MRHLAVFLGFAFATFAAFGQLLPPDLSDPSIAARVQADKVAERWPPVDAEQCVRYAANGTLAFYGVTYSECLEMARTDGQLSVAKWARDGGYYVRDFGLWDVDSAGGVVPYAYFVNPRTDADIKYITVQMAMVNAVGDVVQSRIGGTTPIKFTGPLANTDGTERTRWEPIGYNFSARCLRILSLRVEFMDKKVVTFTGPALAKAIHATLSNCGSIRRTTLQ